MKLLLNRGLLNRGFSVLQNSLPAFHRSSCLLRIPLPRPLSSPTRSGPPSSPQPAASTHQLPLCTSSRTNVSELFPSGCRHWWWRQGPSEAYQAQQLTLNWVYYWPVGKLHLSRHMDYPHGPEWWVVNWSCCNRWFVRLEELPSIFFANLTFTIEKILCLDFAHCKRSVNPMLIYFHLGLKMLAVLVWVQVMQ